LKAAKKRGSLILPAIGKEVRQLTVSLPKEDPRKKGNGVKSGRKKGSNISSSQKKRGKV